MTDREFTDGPCSCTACGDGFVFSAGEQELHRLRGIDAQPEHCPSCVRGVVRVVPAGRARVGHDPPRGYPWRTRRGPANRRSCAHAPPGSLRFLLKVPGLLYRGPFADLFRWRCILLLTTRGRKSGQPRTGAVSFIPVADHFVVFSGWGVTSNWYRNVLANPEVRITVGQQRLAATARVVADPARGPS